MASLTSLSSIHRLDIFICPGCSAYQKRSVLHWFRIEKPEVADGSGVLEWNGSIESPSVKPSILLPNGKCHLYLENGMIRYLKDCTHELAGKTVSMEDIII